jgi:hypothetical protein
MGFLVFSWDKPSRDVVFPGKIFIFSKFGPSPMLTTKKMPMISIVKTLSNHILFIFFHRRLAILSNQKNKPLCLLYERWEETLKNRQFSAAVTILWLGIVNLNFDS